MKMLRAASIFIVIILVTRFEAVASISCGAVFEEVAPCASFLQGNSNQPSGVCCSGVKQLSVAAATQKDRVAICQCLKQGLALVGKYNPTLIPLLPKDCGLSLTLPPIDQNTDCSKAL